MSRARFLAAAGGGFALLVLARLPARAAVRRASAVPAVTVPPGARSVDRYLDSCTACGLCVSACPSKVLGASHKLFGLRGLLAPVLDYAVSYCQYECTSCLDICPSGSLERLRLEQKKLVKIGDAALVRERCIVFTSKTKCGACAEHCPTGAVHMVPSSTGIPEPVFTSSICIGCGACHHACPVRPERAITVTGLAVHETAEEPTAVTPGEPAAAAPPPPEAAPATGEDGFPF
jgi:ferredoxin